MAKNKGTLPIVESFKFALDTIGKHPGLTLGAYFMLGIAATIILLVVLLIAVGVALPFSSILKNKIQLIGTMSDQATLSKLSQVLMLPQVQLVSNAILGLTSGLYLGYAKIMLELKDKNKSHIDVMLSALSLTMRGFVPFFILGGLFIIGGTVAQQISIALANNGIIISNYIVNILVMIPVLMLASRLQFFPFFIVDEDAGAIESLKLSWQKTKGKKLYAFIFMLISYALYMVAAYTYGFVNLIVVPVIALAYAYIYRSLVPKNS